MSETDDTPRAAPVAEPRRPSSDLTPQELRAAEAATPVPRWAIHRRLYDWVLGFAHHPRATWALAGISFAESSFFPIPPDALLAPLCLGHRRRAWWFALVTTIASVLGAYAGYLIGYYAADVALYIPGVDQEHMDKLRAGFEEYGDVFMFVAALTPIPFKVLTITAGAAQMNLLVFGLACVLGRGLRFFAVAGLFWWIGPRAAPLIDKYFNWLTLGAVLLLVAGFLAVRYL